MPSLLQRQLFLELLRLFLLTAGALLTLLIIGRAVRMRELLLGLDIGIFDMLGLFGYMIPLFLLITIPVACMLSTFLTFLRMGTDRELIALRAGGIGILKMLPAPLVFSLVCMGLAGWVSVSLISWGMTELRREVLDIAANRARIEIRPGVFNRDFPNIVLYSRKVDPQTGVLSDIIIHDGSADGRNIVILAPSGDIVTDHKEGALRFILHDGYLYGMADNGSSTMSFKTYTVTIPLSSVFKGMETKDIRPQEMSIPDLRNLNAEIRLNAEKLLSDGRKEEADKSIRYANRLEAEIHKRWTYPVACIVLVLFVLPIAAAAQGLHRQIGMLLALGMFFVYYSLMSLGAVLAEAGTLPVAVAMWIPNTLFFLIGIWGLQMMSKERFPDIGSLARGLFEKVSRRKDVPTINGGGAV